MISWSNAFIKEADPFNKTNTDQSHISKVVGIIQVLPN